MKSDNLQMKEIVPYLNYVGPLFLLLGVTRLIAFYEGFNVDILYYLELSEIITSFLNYIDLLLWMFGGALYTYVILYTHGTKDESVLNGEARTFVFPKSAFWLTASISCVFLGFRLVPFRIDPDIRSLIDSLLWLCLSLSTFLLLPYTASGKSLLIIRLVILFFALHNFVSFIAKNEILTVKKEKSYFGTKVILKDDIVLISDSNYSFVGKTKGYVFFYREKEKSTEVIPVNEIKKIIIKRK